MGARRPVKEAPGAPALCAALDAFFDWYYRTYPVSATFVGVHAHDHRLPDFSDRGAGDALAAIDTLRRRFRDLPPESPTQAQALDRALAEGVLEVQRWEMESSHFHRGNPCVYTGEAIFGVLALFLRPFAPMAVRVDAAIERMLATPALLEQGRERVRRAPRAWTGRALRECTGALAFFEHGIESLIGDERIANPRLRGAAGVAALAFRRFEAYLRDDLLPHAAESYACGDEALDLLLRRGHFVEMTADEVCALAGEHLARSDAELASGARTLGAASWQDALDALADRHAPAGDYYARYAEIWQEAKAAADARGLVTWPDYPIRYVPQPLWAREAAPFLYFLSYRAPAAFDHVPIVDYLVTPIEPDMPPEEQRRRLRAANDGVITLNHVIHHGGLGHHVQNWYAYHRTESRIGQMAGVDCASRIALFCGGTMAEGWACYAVDLMDETGFLDPPERLAQTHTRLRIAARAVADVKLHTGVWTLGETAAFYRDRVGMAAEAARAEAVKTSMFPGTALMYLLGTEQIHRLRADLTARDPGFDVRRFHDRFLSFGSIPVSLIARAWDPTAGRPDPSP